MSDPITFIAALAGTNSSARWLTLGNDNDGKLVLEFPATELAAVLRLAMLARRTFKVTVEPTD